MRVVCSYCDRPAELVGANVLYPHRQDLRGKHFWKCTPCQAWVGCHPKTNRPLGRLANAELRKAKMAVHRVFDPLWKSGRMTRSEAYAALSAALGISSANCHVGMFDVDHCKAAVLAVAEMKETVCAHSD